MNAHQVTALRTISRALLIATLLGACSGEEPPAESPPTASPKAEQEAAAARARAGLYGDQLRALDKAKGVEQQLEDAAAERRKQSEAP